MFIPIRRNGLLFKPKCVNAYGEKEYFKRGMSFGWGYVYDRTNLASSSVRIDSAATKGRAEEIDHDVRIVVEKIITPKVGDKITIGDDRVFEVSRVQERIAINGHLHHWEVNLVTL